MKKLEMIIEEMKEEVIKSKDIESRFLMDKDETVYQICIGYEEDEIIITMEESDEDYLTESGNIYLPRVQAVSEFGFKINYKDLLNDEFKKLSTEE